MKTNNPNKWLKFSQIGLQMGITIGGMTYAGVWLDQKYASFAPWGVVIGSLTGVFASLYGVFKQLKSMEEED